MSKPSPLKKGAVVVEPLDWVSPEMREEQASQERELVAAHDAQAESED